MFDVFYVFNVCAAWSPGRIVQSIRTCYALSCDSEALYNCVVSFVSCCDLCCVVCVLMSLCASDSPGLRCGIETQQPKEDQRKESLEVNAPNLMLQANF